MIRELKTSDIMINGDSTIIKSITKPAILLVWAQWCGYCTRFKPVYNELDQRLNGGIEVLALEDKQITNAKMANAIGVQGYPTIKFVNDSGVIVADYKGDRSIQDLLNHICKFYHYCVSN